MTKSGICLCSCGGVVVCENATIIVRGKNRFLSCQRCYKLWNAKYAFSAKSVRGTVELSKIEEYNFLRSTMRG